ncbi:MAG: HlyC/CorC family transporter [Clostridia bacterium]|nr:HlyC/CorC family transporter [Clostridia bacterium]
MLLQLLLLLVLILCNAFFAASEIAIITLNDNKIQKMADEGHKKAKQILKLTADSSNFLATIQVGVTLAGFLTSASAASTLSEPLAAWFVGLVPAAAGYAGLVQTVCLVLVTIIVSYFSLVLGELAPKRMAMQKAESFSFRVVGLLLVIAKITRPVVWFLSFSTNLIVRLFGMDPHADEEEVTEEEIRMMVDVGEEKGVIEGSQKEMINNIFEFDDIIAEEIMTPRVDVAALDVESTIEEALAMGVETGYSRLPIYEEDIDHTIGVLYVKDLLPYVGKLIPEMLSLRDFVRPTFFTPGTKRGGALFAEMTEKHMQLACVVDEYGGFAGIVTVEDLLESIVGNMQDEFDNEEEEITQLDENMFDVDGFCSIEEVNELLDVELPEGDYETVAGFVLDQLGRIPEKDERPVVTYGRVTLTVMAMDDRAIDRIHIEVAPPPPEESEEKED